MTVESLRICCFVSLVTLCLGLDSLTQAQLLLFINIHWTSAMHLDATGKPDLAMITLQWIQPLRATGLNPKEEPVAWKQGWRQDNCLGWHSVPSWLRCLQAYFQVGKLVMLGFRGRCEVVRGREGLVCEPLEAHSLRQQKKYILQTCWEERLESMNLVVLYLDPGCDWVNKRLQRGKEREWGLTLWQHSEWGLKQDEAPSMSRLHFEGILDNSKKSGKGNFCFLKSFFLLNYNFQWNVQISSIQVQWVLTEAYVHVTHMPVRL